MKTIALTVGLLLALASVSIADDDPAKSTVLVVVAKVKDLDADHYLWAAELTAARLEGNFSVLPGGLAAAIKQSRTSETQVAGILEVLIDVHTIFEEVRLTCFDGAGRERWKRKTEVNGGGSEERMARGMLNRVIKKIEKKKLRCD